MEPMTLGLLILGLTVLLILLRMPVGTAMFICGAAGFVYVVGSVEVLLAWTKNVTYARLSNFDLIVIPMFIMMGQFATHGGLSRALFRFVNAVLGRFRGGVAVATIGACAGFASVCGSSLATAATMGQVALPEMRQRGYSPGLATGAVAAGGTLGILIPPSVPLVIYAILTGESIGKLFIAAIVPAIIAVVGYMLVVMLVVSRNPQAGPAGVPAALVEILRSFIGVLPVAIVFLVVILSIYRGWASPTEASAVGVFACGLIAALSGELKPAGFLQCLLGTAEATVMIFVILLGADMLNAALALTNMTHQIADIIVSSGVTPIMIILGMLLIYIVLGCVMESMAIIMLTVPLFFPIVVQLDLFGLSPQEKSLWFGILALTVVEIGLITPPVGMNVFVVNKMARDVSLMETYRGVLPFLISDLLRIGLLVAVPALSLILVKTM
ncbi:MAG TPA: TRAP transporter large permease [Paracoccus solventivorans]|uniref:TRAP transporter large permease protein n=1 Tax=Paracoccus solventivorans TaxID=53463 RepID=A0A832PQK6_9RHOB|nr:TRAP transporter large permease [Paracoccus solventivorans]HHW35127.1 TRAP transporter large permease [Paracoccus solventivorans]